MGALAEFARNNPRIAEAALMVRLRLLGRLHHADKPEQYYPVYERHFGRLRLKPLTIIEIGIGGHDDPTAGGGSLRMWRAYFPRSTVVGIDLQPKDVAGARLRVFQGSQADPDFLRQVVREVGPPDIVIDDGSHFNEHISTSFAVLFPLLAPGGVYVIEDLHTSYFAAYGGGPPGTSGTSVELVKELADVVNYEARGDDRRSALDGWVAGVHIYSSIAFIEKERAARQYPGYRNSVPPQADVAGR